MRRKYAVPGPAMLYEDPIRGISPVVQTAAAQAASLNPRGRISRQSMHDLRMAIKKNLRKVAGQSRFEIHKGAPRTEAGEPQLTPVMRGIDCEVVRRTRNAVRRVNRGRWTNG